MDTRNHDRICVTNESLWANGQLKFMNSQQKENRPIEFKCKIKLHKDSTFYNQDQTQDYVSPRLIQVYPQESSFA